MKKFKQKYSLLQRIAILMCLFTSLVAVSILFYVVVTMKQLTATSVIDFEEENVTVLEITTSTEAMRSEYVPFEMTVYEDKREENLEKEDLEKCFRQVLLYLAGELIQEVPANVGHAAPREQGSAIWKIIDGTYYCYF